MDVAVLVPHLSNVQLAGPDPDAVSAEGFPMRLAPTANAVTFGNSAETTAARTVPMSNLYSRTRRYPFFPVEQLRTGYQTNRPHIESTHSGDALTTLLIPAVVTCDDSQISRLESARSD
ncbi:hypothetical protein GCM10020218_106290 [Dactylosporangium vinaceum]